ncbi:PepSY domain-containing protein [Streptomyces sp. NPDC088747]|uniref:PepSY domain-containing protein n=1 Tax=Streptomyces sp. NPDC088747 TaxID=3365886 RepID=UPI0037FF0D08
MKRNLVIATVTAAALVGGGTATALAVADDGGAPSRHPAVGAASGSETEDVRDGDDTHEDGEDDDVRADGRDDDRAAESAKVTAADALAAALRHTPGTATSAELEDDDSDDGDDGDDGRGDTLTWDADILGGTGVWHSVRVDAGTGKVLSSGTEREDDDADDADDAARVRAALKDGFVSAVEAAKAAAARGTVTSVELDDDGSPAWEAETRTAGGTDQDWLVDVRTAQVTADRSSDDE